MRGMLGKLGRAQSAVRSVSVAPLRLGVTVGLVAAMSSSPLPQASATEVRVVETSLGLQDEVRLLRHLGLRFGDQKNFVEAHFGPSSGNEAALKEGYLNYGEGIVADSEYLDVVYAGAFGH